MPSLILHLSCSIVQASPLTSLQDWTLPPRISAPVYAFVFPLLRLLSPPLSSNSSQPPLFPLLRSSYKSLPEIWGKLQEATNYNIHRAFTNPLAYRYCMQGATSRLRKVHRKGCEIRFCGSAIMFLFLLLWS